MATDKRPAKTPPPWFMHLFWKLHRLVHRLSGGRFLWTPRSRMGWGAMAVTTVGRRSGQPRQVIVGYLEEGDDLVVVAMNGGEEGHPAWWLNLVAEPACTVRLAKAQPRPMRAREAHGEERKRIWQRFVALDPSHETLDAGRTTPTPVVVFEPAP